MTTIYDDPTRFPAEMLDGLVAANRQYVARVDGGVVRSTVIPDGQVAVVIGGGSGHYPAFAGLVGTGLATASACGNIFSSPSVGQVYRVAKAAEKGGGVLFSYGNYAGDVLNFGEAQNRLIAEGIDARTVLCTDDIASAPTHELEKRRGIAGDLTVFKVAGAAAEAGLDLDQVETLAIKANARTRTLGVAFAGCTLPGAKKPLFTVPAGQMSIGLGIHGEPGISEQPMPSASGLAQLLVERLLQEVPEGAGQKVVPILNGLGTLKYEELFVLYSKVAPLLEKAGLEIFQPECGELVTSLDMSGLSLTLFWPCDELAHYWAAPADTPAYRKGTVAPREQATLATTKTQKEVTHQAASPESVRLAGVAALLIRAVEQTIAAAEEELGQIDAIAGDGDHGIGMSRGTKAAAAAVEESAEMGLGLAESLTKAADEWTEQAGGTSGVLWGAGIAAFANSLGNRENYSAADVVSAVHAGRDAIANLGKAQLGDKTMLDAITPYVDELDRLVAAGEPLPKALAVAAHSATLAAEATKDLRPRVGRARPLAEKSVGHPDPGAVSFALIATGIATSVGQLMGGQP
ncbi:MAG: dihydroxyacetone kinase family protein [Micrococcales bacterium]|nr:dihydroxyacetone kinase family protein [Micrococcales bacterium]